MTIPVLHHRNFRAPVRKLKGFESRCMLALLDDEQGVQRRVYVFAYPHTSKGLANNLAYWLINAYLADKPSDLPTSSAAWLVRIERHFLAALWPEIDWPPITTCWALQELANNCPEALPTTASGALMRDLQAWPHLARTIGVNEMAALNTRQPVVRLGVGRYAAIDGTHILGGEYWTSADLTRLTCTHNHLARMAGWCDAVGATTDEHRKRVSAACATMEARMQSLEELLEWLQRLLSSEAATAAIRFIRARSTLHRTRWDQLQ